MPRVRFRHDAEESLIEIYLQSLEYFGSQQAERYQEGLSSICSLIAEQPAMGQPTDDIVMGSRRHVWKAHVIYYMIEDQGIWIIDILAASRDPVRAIRPPIAEGKD